MNNSKRPFAGALCQPLDPGVEYGAFCKMPFSGEAVTISLRPLYLAVDDPLIRKMPRAQRAVLALALDGLDGPEIAERTGRAYNTVRNHLARIRTRFGVSSNAALLLACCRRGLAGRSVRDIDACEEPATGTDAKSRRRPRRGRR